MKKGIKKLQKKSKDNYDKFIDKLKMIWQAIVLFFKEDGKGEKLKKLFKKI